MKNQVLNWGIGDDIEQLFKVFVDIKTGMYNEAEVNGYNVKTGWKLIPKKWIELIKSIQSIQDQEKRSKAYSYWELYIEKHGI